MKNTSKTYDLLHEEFGISEEILDLVENCEREVQPEFQQLDDIMTYNQYKVLAAFQKNGICDRHFSWNTGDRRFS